jgi:hypothetical protein
LILETPTCFENPYHSLHSRAKGYKYSFNMVAKKISQIFFYETPKLSCIFSGHVYEISGQSYILDHENTRGSIALFFLVLMNMKIY